MAPLQCPNCGMNNPDDGTGKCQYCGKALRYLGTIGRILMRR